MIAAALCLSACGGPGRFERSYGAAPVPQASFASGPIATACQGSGRPDANRSLCRCVQAVADETLRPGDQRQAVAFFSDPDRAQAVKMSREPAQDAFWDRYTAFADAAEGICSAYR